MSKQSEMSAFVITDQQDLVNFFILHSYLMKDHVFPSNNKILKKTVMKSDSACISFAWRVSPPINTDFERF